MCGITAIFGALGTAENIKRATDALIHRGPDADGLWTDQDAGIALGHRRLSILDLSEAGAQPMRSHQGRYLIAFNGEIYNFNELKAPLESAGVTFRGHSDTEILLEHIARFGLEATLKKTVGMFALALWDAQERRLFLARDRFGEKPLYYGWAPQNGGSWCVGSEIKSLRAIQGANWRLDQHALALYLKYTYVPEPFAIYEGVEKIPPGHYAELKRDGQAEISCYWDFYDVVRQGRDAPFTGTQQDAAAELRRLMNDTIALQRVADVPVGAFLSGGIDSSSVVALMQAQGQGEVVTFSIGFLEERFDESEHAAAVAKHLGTRHIERDVTAQEAIALVPELPHIYDEPFGDPSMIPTVFISRLAREHVTVSLSGDAGDEVFGGYGRYHSLKTWWDKLQETPKPMRTVGALAADVADTLCHSAGMRGLARKFADRASWWGAKDLFDLYQRRISKWFDPRSILAAPPSFADAPRRFAMETPYHYAMAQDTLGYLPGDILVKVDRAAMSCSLETRVPMLDHRMVEWAWTLPEHIKIDPEQTKKPLRDVLYQEVPREILERPKMGFGCPVGEWVRDELRDWAEDLLDERKLREQGLLKPRAAREFWNMHLKGEIDEGYQLWTLLMLQAWLEQG